LVIQPSLNTIRSVPAGMGTKEVQKEKTRHDEKEKRERKGGPSPPYLILLQPSRAPDRRKGKKVRGGKDKHLDQREEREGEGGKKKLTSLATTFGPRDWPGKDPRPGGGVEKKKGKEKGDALIFCPLRHRRSRKMKKKRMSYRTGEGGGGGGEGKKIRNHRPFLPFPPPNDGREKKEN